MGAAAFLAMLLVIACHTDDAIGNCTLWWTRYLGGSFSRADVANFFFISGYFLAKKMGKPGWWQEALRKRCSTLLVPYVLWLTLDVAVDLVRDCGACFMGSSDFRVFPLLASPDFGLTRIFGLGFLNTPYIFALWYVKALMMFVIVSPLFLPWVVRSTARTLVAISGCVAIYCCGNYWGWPCMPAFGWSFNILGFAAFLAGAWFEEHEDAIRFSPGVGAAAVAMVAWIGVSAWHFTTGGLTGLILTPVTIAVEVAALQVVVRAMKWTEPGWWMGCGFVVYAMHLPVLAKCAKVMLVVKVPEWVMYPVLIVVGVVVPILFVRLLRRFSPRMLALLSGGRGA